MQIGYGWLFVAGASLLNASIQPRFPALVKQSALRIGFRRLVPYNALFYKGAK